MTEQEKINEAAIKYATEKSSAPDKETPDWIIQDFKAGASYYEKECMPGMMVEFLEWVDRHYKQGVLNEDMYYNIATNKFYNAAELVNLFLEHLKQKQDAIG